MEQRDYQYIENPATLSRRQFISISAVALAALAAPVLWYKGQLDGKNDYIQARINGLYQDDKEAIIRVSHKNPMVAKYYSEFGGEPCNHLSHELLHTHYVDRTKLMAS